MTEEVKEEEVASAEEATQPEVQAPVVEQAPPEDRDWKSARGVMEAQKAEIEALKAHMNLMQSQAIRQPAEAEKDELDALEPGEVVTVEQARKLAAKQAQIAARQAVSEYAQSHAVQMDEDRARTKYEDYDYVIENYALPLIKNDPALAHQVKNSKNPAQTAYKLGLLSDEYQAQTTKATQPNPKAEKILKNSKRPVPAASLGSGLKGQAEDFSKMSQQDIWNLSQQYAKKG